MSSIRVTAALAVLLSALAACGDDGPSGSGPAETGSLELTTVSSGDDLDGDGYALEVDGVEAAQVAANGVATVDEVQVGDREVRLTGVQANCEVAGDNPRTVGVTAGEPAEVAFEVECEDALIGGLAFFSDRDGNMEIYTMSRDGRHPDPVPQRP